jgi:hypothetical protein
MTRSDKVWGIAACLISLSLPALADSGTGSVACEIRENGEAASGVVSLQRDGKELATGTCGGKEISIAPGSYHAVFRLDGALDGPEQSQDVTVKKGSKLELKADFATGTLEVRIVSQGKRAAGMAVIKRGGAQLGTLGSGVSAHLSAGTYEVVARYRTQEKTFSQVQLSRGQAVVLDATFE